MPSAFSIFKLKMIAHLAQSKTLDHFSPTTQLILRTPWLLIIAFFYAKDTHGDFYLESTRPV